MKVASGGFSREDKRQRRRDASTFLVREPNVASAKGFPTQMAFSTDS